MTPTTPKPILTTVCLYPCQTEIQITLPIHPRCPTPMLVGARATLVGGLPPLAIPRGVDGPITLLVASTGASPGVLVREVCRRSSHLVTTWRFRVAWRVTRRMCKMQMLTLEQHNSCISLKQKKSAAEWLDKRVLVRHVITHNQSRLRHAAPAVRTNWSRTLHECDNTAAAHGRVPTLKTHVAGC